MSGMDIDNFDGFFPMELGLTAINNADLLSPHSYTNPSLLQLETISETGPTHFHRSSSFNQMPEVQSPQSYVPTSSPMNISASGHPSVSSFSTAGFDMSSFGSSRQAPMGSLHGPSALTQRLKGNQYGVPSSPAINQPMSPMLTYDTMARQQMPVSSSMPHYSPMNNFGFPFNQDQMLSKQLDLTEYGIKPVVENQDAWMSSSSGSFGTGAVQIPKVNHRRTSSIASSLGSGHHPYRRPPSLALTNTPELIMGMSSPLAPVITMNTPSSLPSELSPVSSAAAGFTPDQVPAAQAIVQFIVEHPNTKIPASLITRELVEASTEGKGYCLIGNCGLVRAGQKADPLYDPSMDKEYRKRVDHLQDHVKDKHFNSRPFTCGYPSCTAAFAREADLKRHGETHNGVKVYCPDHACGKSYTRPDNLGRHIKTKHPLLSGAHSLPVISHVRHSTTPY